MGDNDDFYREQMYRELSEKHESNLKAEKEANANRPPAPPGSGYAALGMVCLPFGFIAALALHAWLRISPENWSMGVAAGGFASILMIILVYLGRGIAFTFRKTWKFLLAGCALAAAYWLYWLHADSFLTNVATRVLWLLGGLSLVNSLHAALSRRFQLIALPITILLTLCVLMGACITIGPNSADTPAPQIQNVPQKQSRNH